MLFEDSFLYGAQYHRPPNPPRNQHGFHLPRIKNELGFNVVKFRLQWNWIERKRGELYLDEVEEMFALTDELGLGVIAEINLETAPYWLEEEHPEARYVNARGDAMELGPYDATQSGGYPGLCFHHESVRVEAARFLRILINAIKHHPSLLAYDCWNEPHLEPAWQTNYWGDNGDKLYCYCEASVKRFREWLEEKYTDIEVLNEKWTRAYNSFSQLTPPRRHGNYADWLDWMRFWFDELADFLRLRYEIIKESDPTRQVLSHSGAVPPFLPRATAFIHNWKLAKEVDAWGTSFAPKAPDWRLADMSGVLDATRSAAGEKPWWVAEMSGGCLYSRGFIHKMPYTRPKDVRAWNWISAVSGAKGICYWCYLTETTGPEAGGFGLIPLNGELSERAIEAGRQAKLLNDVLPVLRDYKPKTEVAVLYDPDNSSLLFAMENTDELYSRSFSGYTRAIFECDVLAKYVTYDTIDELSEKVLIVPMCLTINEQVVKKIRSFVERGGVLICDAKMGLFDEHGYLQPTIPSFGLHEAAGLSEGESYCSDRTFKPSFNDAWPDEVYNGPTLNIEKPLNTTISTAEYLSALRLSSAEAIGSWDNLKVAAHNTYGKGEVWYFGTYVGLAISRGDENALALVKSIIKKYVSPRVVGDSLRPRLIDGDGRKILCVFNDDPYSAHEDSLTLNFDARSAKSLFDGSKVDVLDGKIKLNIDADDVAVLEIF